MPENCRPKFISCSLRFAPSSGMATKKVVIGARAISYDCAGAARTLAAAAAMSAECSISIECPSLVKAGHGAQRAVRSINQRRAAVIR